MMHTIIKFLTISICIHTFAIRPSLSTKEKITLGLSLLGALYIAQKFNWFSNLKKYWKPVSRSPRPLSSISVVIPQTENLQKENIILGDKTSIQKEKEAAEQQQIENNPTIIEKIKEKALLEEKEIELYNQYAAIRMPDDISKNVNQLRNTIERLTYEIRTLQILPLHLYEINDINIYQIYSTEDFDPGQPKTVTCGPATIAFIGAIQEVFNKNTYLTRKSVEIHTPHFFQKTNAALDNFDMQEIIQQKFNPEILSNIFFLTCVNESQKDQTTIKTFQISPATTSDILQKKDVKERIIGRETPFYFITQLMSTSWNNPHYPSFSHWMLFVYIGLTANAAPGLYYMNDTNVQNEDIKEIAQHIIENYITIEN